MAIHIFACVWLFILLNEPGSSLKLPHEPTLEELDEFLVINFVNNTYFIITSVTTIGYGDFKAITQWERLYMMLV